MTHKARHNKTALTPYQLRYNLY